MPLPKTIIKRDFPKVKRIVDATETIDITVLPEDAEGGRRKDPRQCALAKACVRQKIADAAIIGIGFSYLIKGDTATRYKTSVGVGREITSYDRHKEFASGGDYKLSKVSPCNRLGVERPHPENKQDNRKRHDIAIREPILAHHHTKNVRVNRTPKD